MERNLTSNLTASTPSLLDANTTNVDKQSATVIQMLEIAKWINGFIILLGLITNTLVLMVLSRRRIGSQTTRIILMFLAATDLTVMVVELFVHYIPFYWEWFPVFYTDLSCGVAYFFQASFITTSSWYIMLMTIERFTVVWLPMKAKLICTQKKILTACCIIPIIVFICYYYLLTDFVTYDDNGYTSCTPKETVKEGGSANSFKVKIQIWIVLYFFLPAAFIVILNIAIVVKLSKAHKIQKTLSTRRLSRKISRTNSQVSNSISSIKKATTMVIAASVTFVILMIPRGVSTTITLDANWKYDGDAEYILDITAYLLQYLNHACNFFLYVLANNSFRKELLLMFKCHSGKAKYYHRPVQSQPDTDVTQMTPKRRLEHENTTGAVKLTLHYCLDTLKFNSLVEDDSKNNALLL